MLMAIDIVQYLIFSEALYLLLLEKVEFNISKKWCPARMDMDLLIVNQLLKF